jgi:hypothetical protein
MKDNLVEYGVYVLHQLNKFLSTIKKQGYHDVVVNQKNKEFLDFLDDNYINKKNLRKNTLAKYWEDCFNEKLTEQSINKKIKLFTKKTINLKIKFVDTLPTINTHSSTILILESISDEFIKYWKEFQNIIYKSEISPDRTAKSDFEIDEMWTYQTIIEMIPTFDEGNKKRYRQKKLYYLFFLFLVNKQKALLCTQYIMSEDTFFNYTSRLEILTFFNKNHFFFTKPFNKNLIEKELNVNNKAKYINYMRFSYLINQDINLLINLTNNDVASILNNLRNSAKSSKMVSVYENPIRKSLYWLGATNINQTRKEAFNVTLSPLEILYENKQVDSRYLKIFYPYFSSKPNNLEQRKYARSISSFIIFLNNKFSELSVENLTNFFSTSIVKENELNEIRLNSEFLDYLYQNISSKTQQQEIQMIVYQSFGNYPEFRNCFLKNDLEKIYVKQKNRKISRLALEKRILTKMKEICIFNPIVDNYYVTTHIDKKKYIWKHFDKTEPQLPVMLFLFLSMLWRKEHIVSLDRDNFLRKNENGEIIEVHVTTDKNQNNNFIIEKEYFEYVIRFKDLNGNEHCPIELIVQTIEYCKESFPMLKSLYRKGNETWGKIKPILCRNTANGFSPDYVFTGYYYKVFLRALQELNYPYEKINHFIQLSEKGLKEIGDYSNIYSSLENISLNQAAIYFNSVYFSPHSIRKTNITYLIYDKKSLEFIIKLSGHTALSTVLKIYIDYDLLNRLHISEKNKTAIENNFRQTSKIGAKKIIEIYQKFHSLSINDIKKKLSNENLFFSPLILGDNNILKKNNFIDIEILEPIFWEEIATGICTNALNCQNGRNGTCSICPFFLTSSNFIDSINSKIMQLSSRIIEYFNIILKHYEDEKLSGKEAIIYENELQLTIAQMEGYSAIVNTINTSLYEKISNTLSDSQKKNLPMKQDMVFIKYEHTPHLKAQLEIYKYSKKFTDHNMEIEHSIDVLYKKIMELIILNEIPKEFFIDTINNKEAAVERFLELLNNNSNNVIQSIKTKYLLE